jgi:hypothetical protein
MVLDFLVGEKQVGLHARSIVGVKQSEIAQDQISS